MDFGRVPDANIISFGFPNEHAGNVNILPGFPAAAHAIYVGCPIWSDKSWIGKIYPKGTKEKDFLSYYATRFSTIELNATHYSIPDKETINKWCAAVPDHFKFCPKVPQAISHAKDLVSSTDLMLSFIDRMNDMGSKLGPSFLQLPPYFKPDKLKSLIYFLNALPDTFQLSIEFRHEEWFSQVLHYDKIVNYLEDRLLGMVTSDVAGRRDVLHLRMSNRTVFVRFGANDLHPTDFTRLDEWIVLLKKWINEGVTEVYFFIHTQTTSLSPELTNYMIQRLMPDLPPPKEPDTWQGSLF